MVSLLLSDVEDELAFGMVEGRDGEEIVYNYYKLLDNNRLEEQKISHRCMMSDVLTFNFDFTQRQTVHKVLLRKLFEKVTKIRNLKQ